MNLSEVISVLEDLKDHTNDHGCGELIRVIASIQQWESSGLYSAVLPLVAELPPSPAPEEPAEVDPGQHEQQQAMNLGLTK